MKKRRLAIFDIDGTVFRSSLLIELTEGLIRNGIFPQKARKLYLRSYQDWLNRRRPYKNYIDKVIKTFIQNIKGVSEKEFSKVVKNIVAFHSARLYCYTRDLIKKLKKKGYYLLAISNSPKKIVDEFCKKLGFEKVYGQMYKIDKKGRFTGEILYPELIFNKAKILKRAIKKENLTLKKSIGIGDTESDIAFLKMVEKPICFNPNRKLYQYAKRHNWQIVVERKDVIYHFKK
ncbi:MAG: HAD family hydrolase [Patescibacteria group bacterium]